VARLLADFGHTLPPTAPPPSAEREPRLFHHVGRFGLRRRGRGWAAARAAVSTWRMTSDQAPVLWPFISAPGLPPTGAQMGIDQLSGGSFYADPLGWVLRDDIPITNPNLFVFGKPGRGKSATVKAFVLRMMDFGYRTLVLGDPKDEYEKLCSAFGVQPFAIGPGLPTRINPLAFGPLGQGWTGLSAAEAQARAAVVFGRWLTLLRGLVGSQRIGDQRVPFGPTEEMIVKTALTDLTGYTAGQTRMREVTIPQLWRLLDSPTDQLVTDCRYQSARHFLDESRLLRDALGQLVSGALAGLFDDHTTIDVDWAAPIQSLSLSRLEPLGEEAVGIALTCLNSWGRGMRELAAPGDLRIVVRDESWKQLRLGAEADSSFLTLWSRSMAFSGGRGSRGFTVCAQVLLAEEGPFGWSHMSGVRLVVVGARSGSFSQVRRVLLRLLVGLLFVALIMSSYDWSPGAAADPLEPAPAPSRDWVEPTGSGPVRPDFVSASVTARASGQRVEVLSERSETARTWALPLGGYESETSAAPVRFEKPGARNDGWVDIDTTLVANADGTVSPRAVPDVVTLGGQGDPAAELISTTSGDRTLSLGAGVAEVLPAPVLDGATATYADVMPGVDVKVEIRPSGFEQLWVVKTQAGLDELISEQASGDQGVAAAMSADGLVASPQSDGGVVFTAEDTKKVVAKLAPPTVWDAATDTAGNPTAGASADFDVVDKGDPLPPKAGATGDLELSVVPDQEWLSDPERQFPITIDPTYVAGTQQGPIFDTWVKEGETVDRSSNNLLPAGMGSDGLKHRSFLTFSTTPFQGKYITSASLSLWGNDVGSCTASAWSAYDAGLSSTSTRWTAQPTIGTKYATSTQTKGGASCPDGLVSIDMKAQVQSWADGTATSKGMALKADNETTYASYHRFSSSEAASNQPVLRWSYDRRPGQMTIPNVSPGPTYKPAGSSASYVYTSSTKPTLSGVVPADADGDVMRARFYAFPDATTADGSLSSSYCTPNAYVAGGSSATCALTTALTANTSYWVRARAQDSVGYNGPYSDGKEIRIASVVPSSPVITCPGLSNNTWTTTGPSANVSCTITAAGTGYSAPSAIKWSVDGSLSTTTAIPQSSSTATAKITVTLSNKTGGHKITAQAINPAGLTSAQGLFQTGWGTASLTLPKVTPQVTTTDTVAVEAAGPPKGGSALPTAKVQWRVAGATGSNGWKDAPPGTTFAVTDAAGGTKATAIFDTTALVGEADASSIAVGERTATLLNLRVCLSYDSGTQCTAQSTVQRVPHAYGSGFPEADAGPGKVALWTGELLLSEKDATLATPEGDLEISRTHTSFSGIPAIQNQVFGPGWRASFESDISGASGAEILDNTLIDGTISVSDSDGLMLLYATPASANGPAGTRRTSTELPAGEYAPANEDTAVVGSKLTVTGSNTSTVLEVKGEDGVVTRFGVTTAPTASSPAKFKTLEVRGALASGKTTYSYDAAGRVVAMFAALPDGVTSCVSGTPTAGCRILKVTYAASTTATSAIPGDYVGQVKQLSAQVNTDSEKTLASFKYDASGRMTQSTENRTNLTTNYSWSGSGSGLRLSSVTPPGEAAYTFDYSVDKLSRVTRPNPASAGGGTAQIGAFVYDVAMNGTVTGLPNMVTEVDKWNQTRKPAWAAASFGQNKAINGTPAANSMDWQYADIQFTDTDGNLLNTARYGAGDWQITARDYDDFGNIIRSWDERAIGGIRNGTLAGMGAAADVATLTVYNDEISIDGEVVLPAGARITGTFTPVHAVVGADGDVQPLRTHTVSEYDQDAPNSGINPQTSMPYNLITRETVTSETAAGQVDETIDISLTGYESISSGDPSGWALGMATSVTSDMDLSGTVTSGDITHITRYDSRSRVIETRQPNSSGADAGSRITTYYTGSTSPVPACGSKPQWSGQVCQVGPGAQSTGQTLPTAQILGYTWDLKMTSSKATSGSVTSTTMTTFNTQDRAVSSATVVAGLSASTAIPTVTTTYDTATGRVTGTSSSMGSTAATYDNWGRQITYTNTANGQAPDTSTTTFDTNGQAISVVDNNGQTVYVYDGIDAADKTERRGQVTAIKVKTSTGLEYTTTGAYDQGGDLVLEKLPGNLIRRTTRDVTGSPTESSVNGQGVDPITGSLAADQPWLAWSTKINSNSQVVAEHSPGGGSLDTSGDANREYGYDRAGRLTSIRDRTGDPLPDGTIPCAVRNYSFDANGNRTSQTSFAPAADGACSTTGGTTVSRAYDSADRPTTGANAAGSYVYDQLGRQTTIPASDSPTTSAGPITVSYYDSDDVRSITQNGTATTYVLDGAGRRITQTTTSGGTTSAVLTRHYTDASDKPTWSVDVRGTISTTTRYNELISGELGLTFTNVGNTTSAELTIATPRGDTATSVALTASMTGFGASSATGIGSWNTYSEFGTPQQAPDVSAGGTTGIGYGWLGAEQRSSESTGLILMGARVYNNKTAMFTSLDPVFGGNETAYGYPTDPINNSDITGTYELNNKEKALRNRHPILAGAVLYAGNYATNIIRNLFGGLPGQKGGPKTTSPRGMRADAMKHGLWMALSYRELRRYASNSKALKFAEDWGIAHEFGTPDGKAESQKDIYNNTRGRRIGVLARQKKWNVRQITDHVIWASSADCRGNTCLQLQR
jgi:RHS repeat-associated protein